MAKKGRTLSSTGEDKRSAAEIRAEIEASEAASEAPTEIPTPDRSEPEAPAEPEVAEVEERPKFDDGTGLPLVYEAKEPESAPEKEPEKTPEVEEQPKLGTFKTPEAVFEAYENLRRVYDREQNKNRDLEGNLQSLREQMARLEGVVSATQRPEPEPRAQEPTEEQLAELATENPAKFAAYVREQARRDAEARVSAVERELETERAVRLQQERAQFALREIPEIRAVAAAKGDESKMDPGHVEFVQRYTRLIQQFPDMAQSNEKMEIAANAVRQTLYKERVQAEQTRASKSPAKPPQPPKEDVFLESAAGRAATTSKVAFAKGTAAEMRRQLLESGVPVVDRG